MAVSTGTQIAQEIREKIEAFKSASQGLDEQTASNGPAGRWSPKQIVSHLLGPEGIGVFPAIQMFVHQDTPELDASDYPENPHFTENRAGMDFDALVRAFEDEYGQIADFLSGLSQEQVERKAHIPLFKDTPLGEYPTLGDFALFLASHINDHVTHMREIVQESTKSSSA